MTEFRPCRAGTLTNEDLSNKAFLFPKETANAHIILNPEAAKPLEKLTVCLRSYTELTREHSLFSLACPGSEKDNTFLILTLPPNVYSVYVNQEENRFKIDPEVLDWKHTCVSWNSDTGVIQLWVNGKLYPRKISNKGFTIPIPTFIILGQDQDSFGGGFQAAQSFVGEMRDVHMWDFVLSQEDIQNVLVNDINGNVLSWTALQYESNGEVVVPFKVQSKSLRYPTSLYPQF
ncbi:Hypothetical predicted protein [Pelobates cultripes]|uniref:Pentraxin family member n=1 Tax=Pelobates cultripes TaxID=61616 RepID=A0AAD1T699_PELCU|nr:Hypothetical predicted protein [Pelobates cultripes]